MTAQRASALTTVKGQESIRITLVAAVEGPPTGTQPAVLSQALALPKSSIATLLKGDTKRAKAGLGLLASTAEELQKPSSAWAAQ
jgi:hypothetical protein